MSFTIGEGDLEPAMLVDCLVNGSPEDISDATVVKLHWTRPDGTTSDVDLTAVDLARGHLMRTWVAGDTSQPGTHRAQVTMQRTGARQQTFPSDNSHVTWVVTPKLPA